MGFYKVPLLFIIFSFKAIPPFFFRLASNVPVFLYVLDCYQAHFSD